MGNFRTARVTEEEFLALPESLEKIELLDGEVVITPPPSSAHQIIVHRIGFALTEWARTQTAAITVGHAPWDFRFGQGRILQPDVFVVFGRLAFDHEGPVNRIPELCIEVLSSNRVHDRVTKRRLYGDAGVQEYWVVDPVGVVERWTGAGLTEAKDVTERLTSTLLPGFELDLVSLFRRDSSAGS